MLDRHSGVYPHGAADGVESSKLTPIMPREGRGTDVDCMPSDMVVAIDTEACEARVRVNAAIRITRCAHQWCYRRRAKRKVRRRRVATLVADQELTASLSAWWDAVLRTIRQGSDNAERCTLRRAVFSCVFRLVYSAANGREGAVGTVDEASVDALAAAYWARHWSGGDSEPVEASVSEVPASELAGLGEAGGVVHEVGGDRSETLAEMGRSGLEAVLVEFAIEQLTGLDDALALSPSELGALLTEWLGLVGVEARGGLLWLVFDPPAKANAKAAAPPSDTGESGRRAAGVSGAGRRAKRHSTAAVAAGMHGATAALRLRNKSKSLSSGALSPATALLPRGRQSLGGVKHACFDGAATKSLPAVDELGVSSACQGTEQISPAMALPGDDNLQDGKREVCARESCPLTPSLSVDSKPRTGALVARLCYILVLVHVRAERVRACLHVSGVCAYLII